MARTGRYEEVALHKAGVGANRPRVQHRLNRMRIMMTAVHFSSAVVSRREKYDGDFQVPTLLGVQLLDHTVYPSPPRHAQYRHDLRT